MLVVVVEVAADPGAEEGEGVVVLDVTVAAAAGVVEEDDMRPTLALVRFMC